MILSDRKLEVNALNGSDSYWFVCRCYYTSCEAIIKASTNNNYSKVDFESVIYT